MTFTLWHPIQPNNSLEFGDGQDRIHLWIRPYPRRASHWNDLEELRAVPGYIMEPEAPPVPALGEDMIYGPSEMPVGFPAA